MTIADVLVRAEPMRRTFGGFSLITLLALAPLARANDQENAAALAALIYAPAPEYPRLARETHREGTGKFEGIVNSETGKVSKVLVVQSTGYQLLDAAAIGAIRRWRVKPHTIEAFYVPLDFRIGGAVGKQLRVARTHTTYAPAPVYPYAMYRYGVHASGRYQITVDSETGRVTNVKVLATSRVLSLDQSCLATFRRWRFVPHTVKTLTVNFSF